MRKSILFLFFLMVSVFAACQDNRGYNIGVSIDGLSDSTIYLAFHMGDKQYVRDTLTLDNKGHGVFSGSEALPGGIYLIVIPGKQYFEVLVSEDQYFSLSCSYPDYVRTLSFTGSDENNAFIRYQKRWVEMQQKATGIVKRLQASKQVADSVTILSGKQRVQEEEMKAYLRSVIKENEGNLLSALVKAILPVETPVFNVPAGSKNPDSLKWVLSYNFNKDHFFDNIDLSDSRLVRTPILQARLNSFFTNVVIQLPDSINNEIDVILEKCKNSHEVFQFVAVYLFNHFRESGIMGHDAVVVKLADDVYLNGRADWVTKEFKDDLKKQVELIRPNLIGKRAQNLIMDSYKGIHVALDDIDKDYTILYFWEPDCGHCKEATPKLREYYEKNKNESIEIFAVCTTAERDKWEKYISENNLTWINGWDPERRSNFGFYYNVSATPLIYILDRNKTIIAKKIGVEDIGPFIESHRKYFSR